MRISDWSSDVCSSDLHLKNLPDCLCIFKPDYGIDAGLLHEQTAQLLPVFAGRLWLGLGLRYRHADAQHLATLKRAARQLSIRTVAIGQVELHSRSRHPLPDPLSAIRLNPAVQHRATSPE